MNGHTPAPWKYKQTPLPQVWSESVIEAGSNLEKRRIHIADVRGWGALQYREDGAAMHDANGLLIAAAPEMYDALQDLISCAEMLEEFQEIGSDFWLSLHEANTALAKAEGRRDA